MFVGLQYCHRGVKLSGQDQCSKICLEAAKVACLLCKSRPKYKQYHLCGKSCQQISTKRTPLLLDAPEGHATWDLGGVQLSLKFVNQLKGFRSPKEIRNRLEVSEWYGYQACYQENIQDNRKQEFFTALRPVQVCLSMLFLVTHTSHHVPQEKNRQKYRSVSVPRNIKKVYPRQQWKYLALQ